VLFIRFSLFILFVSLAFSERIFADSTHTIDRKLNANLSGSFLNLSNWKGESFGSFTIFLGSDYYSRRATGSQQRILTGKSEVGYAHRFDSLWSKQSDSFNLQFVLKLQNRKFSQSLNAFLNSQLLNSYATVTDGNQQRLKRKWKGSFMNPSTVELGYGLNVLFWEKSNLNIAIASARFRIDPVYENQPKPASGVFGKVNRGWLLFDYGLSGQLLLVKNLSNELEWNSTGKVFLKGFKKETIQFDVTNTMSYKFWKHIEMRADVKLVYDPLVSFKMQYRNELLFGFVFKYNK